MVQDTLTQRYINAGVINPKNHNGPKEVASLKQGIGDQKLLKLIGDGGQEIEVNELLWAIGRRPQN